MKTAHQLFAKTRDEEEKCHDTYDGWYNAEYCAKQIQKDFPNINIVDIMVPDWKDWLVLFAEENKKLELQPKPYLCELLFNKHIVIVNNILGIEKEITYSYFFEKISKTVEAAANFKANETEWIKTNARLIENRDNELRKNHKLSEKDKNKILFDLEDELFDEENRKLLISKNIKEYKINKIEFKCGNVLFEIIKYMDFLFRYKAHDSCYTGNIEINPSILPELAVRLSKINELLKELSASIKQEKSREPMRVANMKAQNIWRKHNLKRDELSVIELKRLYEKETGSPLKQSIRTIRETWMPLWRKNKLAS